jgi:hypothetical protein
MVQITARTIHHTMQPIRKYWLFGPIVCYKGEITIKGNGVDMKYSGFRDLDCQALLERMESFTNELIASKVVLIPDNIPSSFSGLNMNK